MEFGVEHPRLNDDTMQFVIRAYLAGFDDRGYGDGVEVYRKLIDAHFDTDYNCDIDWTIQHFMSGDIRDILFYKNIM